MKKIIHYIGLDVHKDSISAAIAVAGGEVRHYGKIGGKLSDMDKLIKQFRHILFENRQEPVLVRKFLGETFEGGNRLGLMAKLQFTKANPHLRLCDQTGIGALVLGNLPVNRDRR